MKKLFFLFAVLVFTLISNQTYATVLFGKTSTAGTSNYTYTATRNIGSVFACSTNGTVHYLEVYCNATGNDLKLAIYSADGTTKLKETNSFTAASGWNKVALTSTLDVTSGTSYAIVLIGSATCTNQTKRSLDGEDNTGVYNSSGVTWPNFNATVTVTGNAVYCMYAEDDVSSSPTYTPTATPTRTVTPTRTPTITPTTVPTPLYSWYPYRWTDSPLPGQPQAVCYYKNKVWVTINEEAGSVCEVDPDTLAVLSDTTVGGANGGGNPQSVYGAFDYIWTGNISDYTISRVNCTTYAMTNTSDENYSDPNMLTDDGTYLYVAAKEWSTNKDMVAKINPTTMAQVSKIYLSGTNGMPYGICYGNSKIFCGRFTTQDVVVVDPVAGIVLATIKIPITNSPCDMVYYDGAVYIASWGAGKVWKMDATSYVVTDISLDFSTPQSWVVYGCTYGGGYIWATDYESGRLHKIYPALNQDVGWADCSMNPQGVAYGNGWVFTADALNHEIVKLAAGGDFEPTATPTPRAIRQKKNYYPTTYFWNY